MKGRPTVKYRDAAVSCAKMAEPIEMLFGIWTRVGPRNHILGAIHTDMSRKMALLRSVNGFLSSLSALGWNSSK